MTRKDWWLANADWRPRRTTGNIRLSLWDYS